MLLVDPGRAVSGAFDDVLPTSVGLRPGGSKSRAQVGDDRLVVPIIPGPLNASAARLTIGRARVCDVVLPYPEVSKVHAYLHRGAPGTDSSYEIEDAGSMNGTSVNGKHLPRGERHAMVDRCKVSIGGIEAEYRVAAVFRAEVLARLAI